MPEYIPKHVNRYGEHYGRQYKKAELRSNYLRYSISSTLFIDSLNQRQTSLIYHLSVKRTLR